MLLLNMSEAGGGVAVSSMPSVPRPVSTLPASAQLFTGAATRGVGNTFDANAERGYKHGDDDQFLYHLGKLPQS
jgi:hypothetical protein